MRRTLLAVISTIVLGAGLLAPSMPAHAAAAAYTVQGHPISAPGLRLLGDGCNSSTAPPTVTYLERQGGTSGGSALGWSVNQAASEAGPVAAIPGDPTTLHTARVDVLAPTGTSGHAYARFAVGNNAYYVGWRSFSVPAGGWINNDLTNVAYYWSYYYNGQFVSKSTDAWTIQQYAQGTGATGAEVGVLLGCGGEQFYVDSLVLANASSSVSYDFEAAAAAAPPAPPPVHHVAHLEWSTNGRDVKLSDRVVVSYGQSLWMLGHGHLHSDSAGNSWYAGRGTLTAERTRGGVNAVGSKSFHPKYYAAYKLAPKEETTYRFTVDAQGGHAAAASNLVNVFVRSKVKARVKDRHLVEGQRLAVGGQVWPKAKGVKVTLQRKVGRKWTSVSTGRSSRNGTFAVGAKVRAPGTWTVRVRVGATLRNLGTTTRSAKVRVDRYVPPKPNTPPPPPPQDSTPEAPAPVVTVQPTQVPAAAPVPPDRPTPTGRATRTDRAVELGERGRTEAVGGAGAAAAKQ